MSNKVSYASLKIKPETEVKTLKFQDKTIEVIQYLDVESKYDLIMITLQKSQEGKLFSSFKLDMYFHLHLIYMYTNISFTQKQQENEIKLYDALASSGLVNQIIALIPDDEYTYLRRFITDQAEKTMRYNASAGGVVNEIIKDLPSHAQAAMDIVNNFDKSKFQEVIDFAQAANGNRPISTTGQN